MQEIDELVLTAMPRFIAVRYRRMLDAETWPDRIEEAGRVLELGLKALALGIASQYVFQDRPKKRVVNSELDHLLIERFLKPKSSLEIWKELLLTALWAYEKRPDLFFIPELYDLYWDTSTGSPRPRPEIHKLFNDLVQIRIEKEYDPPANEEGWEELDRKTIDLLHEALRQFVFFRRYELIRITALKADRYHYERHTGLDTTPGEAVLQAEKEVNEGRFYLLRDGRDLLELHPWLVFWDEPDRETDFPIQAGPEAAMYDALFNDVVRYLRTELWGTETTITRPELFKVFLHRVLKTFDKVEVASQLDWGRLQRLTRKISEERIRGAIFKYKPELYLQRKKAKAAFHRFLASAERCFVLVGGSGVGKSNFLVALTKEYYDHPTVCLLAYDGAWPTLVSLEKDLTTIITEDFDAVLEMEGRDEGIGNIWREINRLQGIQSRKVVLIIDAINESPEPAVLLQRVNSLLEQKPWSWLKIVLISRPQVWRNMMRRVRLPKGLYFVGAEGERIGPPLEFTYSHELKPFELDELAQVYHKYRQKYSLETDFNELSTKVTQALRDPLVLWLISDTYRGQKIPRQVRIADVYENYIEALIRTERLSQHDLNFLEQQLMPLMIREGRYGNTISAQVIDSAPTSEDGRKLEGLIHETRLLGTGQPVNISFTNLVDAQILQLREYRREYEIAFGHDRFYDFFMGKRIFQTEGSSAERYLHLFSQMYEDGAWYLWKPIINALVSHLSKQNDDLILRLCRTRERNAKEILCEALSEYGKDQPERILTILERLLGANEDMARAIAIEVACRLASQPPVDQRVIEVIANGTLDDRESVRRAAMRSINYLSLRESGFPESSLKILEYLCTEKLIRFGFLPSPRALNAISQATMLSVQDRFRHGIPEDEFTSRLLNIIRTAARKILLVGDEKSRGEMLKRQIRNVSLSVLTNVVMSIMALPSPARDRKRKGRVGYANLAEIKTVFNRPLAERTDFVRTVATYLTPDQDNLEEMASYLVRKWQQKEAMYVYLTVLLFVAQGYRNPDNAIAYLNDLFDADAELRNQALGAWAAIVEHQATARDNWLQAGRRFVHEILAMKDRPYGVHFSPVEGARYQDYPLNMYGAVWCKMNKNEEVDLVREYFDKAVAEDDEDLLRHIIESYGDLRHDLGCHKNALRTLQPLLEDDRETIRASLIDSLARLRAVYPDQVEEFLLESDAPTELVTQVERRSLDEPLEFPRFPQFVVDLAVHAPTALRRTLLRALEEAAFCSNVGEAVKLLAKRMLNEICGEEVFRLPETIANRG